MKTNNQPPILKMHITPSTITRKRQKRARSNTARNDMNRSLWTTTICFTMVLASSIPVRTHAQTAITTCSFDGVVYPAGAPLGDRFTTRCGSAADFPCFCNPNTSPPIDCPYCGIATQDNAEGLLCARIDGPTVTVVDLQGEAKDCTCQRDILTGDPESVCVSSDDDNDGAPSAAPPSPPTPGDNVCTLEWDDGTTDVFQDGESYGDLFQTQCGTPAEYPCFCNVAVPGKLDCPYCGVVDANLGDLVCGRVGGDPFQVTDVETSEELTCTCGSDLEADCAPTALTTPAPTTRPTLRPTLRPTVQPTTPTIINTPTPTPSIVDPLVPTLTPSIESSPSLTPTTVTTLTPTIQETSTRRPSAPLPTLDKPSILMPSRTPPISIPVPGCTYEQQGDNLGFVETGGIIDSQILQGPCAPSGSYPVYCNPELPGGVEYPYCVFTMDGEWSSTSTTFSTTRQGDDLVVCAKSGDQVSVPTTRGTIASCSCLYLNPYIGAVSSCPDLLVTALPLALTPSPSALPTVAPTMAAPTTPETPPSTDPPSSSSAAISLLLVLVFLLLVSTQTILLAASLI
jgi:hypothetical protein